MQLVSTVAEVIANIRTYQKDIIGNEGLQARISKTIWWYAAKDDETWIFAPSKWVGYVGMNAADYLSNYALEMDGRDTEKNMSAMFVQVAPGASEFNEIESALQAFVTSFGKTIGRRFKGFRVAPDLLDSLGPARRTDKAARIAARIVSDPGICGGRPRIRGTRVRVVDIMEMLAAGMRPEEVLTDFPYLTAADIEAALAYSARAVDHSIFRAA